MQYLPSHKMFYYLKYDVVSQNKYFMWFSKAIVHRAIHLMMASQFAICHLAPDNFPNAPMFQAQQASIECSTKITKSRAMFPGHKTLFSTRQYVINNVITEFPKL